MPSPGGPDLTGSGCHAVVVGAGSHPGDRLRDLATAVPSAEALAEALRTECGMGDRVRVLADPKSPSEVLQALAEATDLAAPTEDRPQGGVVVFCFVGHGLRGPGGRLYLATAATKSLTDFAHSVPYDEVERYLSDAAADPVVILDCCFAGNAREPSGGPAPGPFGGSRPQGSYLLGSALRDTLAYAPEGAEHTLFTGHLLDLLREGDAGAPKWLTLGGVYRLLDQRLQGGAARPYGGGTARMAELVLTVNRRYPARPAAAPVPPPDDDAVCPYPGIVPFLPEQHRLFFGREEVTRRLLARVVATRPAKPLVVIGTSGVGKSSLLRAGLAVAAERAGLGPVRIVPGPGARPLRELAEAWAAAVERPLAEVLRDLEQGRFTHPGPGAGPAPGVLVVDQLEQYFTHGSDIRERERFAAALTAADGPRVVLALRADYHDDALKDPCLAPLVERDHFTVPALNDAELEAAIVRPAEQVGLEWEQGVPRMLRREVNEERHRGGAGDAAGLPFLAYVLREIWLRRHGTTLTYAGYQQAGGIRDAVARTADRIHDSLGADGRVRLRNLMLAMVHVADGEGRLVRRRVPRQELTGYEDLLRRLADAHLVVVDTGGGAQLGHDSLLYAWGRLSGWIDEVREDLVALRRLTSAAEGWDENGRTSSGLWTGDSLDAAQRLVQDAGGDGPAALPRVPVRQVVRDFVAAGAALAAAGRRAERNRRRTRTAAGVLAALVLVGAYLVQSSLRESREAEYQKNTVIARELAAKATSLLSTDPRTALRLGLAAYRTAATPESRSSLYRAAAQVGQVQLTPAQAERHASVTALAFSPDGKVLAAGHEDKDARLWDVSDPTTPRAAGGIPLGPGTALAYRPGSRLLAAQSDGRLTLWDTGDPRKPRKVSALPSAGGVTKTLAFSRDGRTLAAGDDDGRLTLWDVSDPLRPRLRAQRKAAEAALGSLAFTGDGKHLVTGGTDTYPDSRAEPGHGRGSARLTLWDVTDPDRPVARDTEKVDEVTVVAAHPRRDLLVSADTDGEAVWWQVLDGRELRREGRDLSLADGFSVVRGATTAPVGFSPDGTGLAVVDGRDGARLLRLVGHEAGSRNRTAEVGLLPLTPVLPSTPRPSSGVWIQSAESVAYRGDGHYLAVGEASGEIRLWPTAAETVPALDGRVPGFSGAAPGVGSVSRDGRFVVTDRSRIWDTTGRRGPVPRSTLPEGWGAKYFLTGRDRPVLLAYHDDEVGLWGLGTNGRVTLLSQVEIGRQAQNAVDTVSPDNQLLLASSGFEGYALWDITDPRHPVRRGSLKADADDEFARPSFTDERTVAMVDHGHVRLWDVTDPSRPRAGARMDDVTDAEVLPSAHLLADRPDSGHVRLWDVSRASAPAMGDLLEAPEGFFATTEGELVTRGAGGTLTYWDVGDPSDPRVKRTVDLVTTDSTLHPSPDGRYVVVRGASGVRSVQSIGHERTQELATLAGVVDVSVAHGRMAVTVAKDQRPRTGQEAEEEQDTLTFLLDLDTDRLYDTLCEADPQSVPESAWKDYFPRLPYRMSCDPPA
ncbi:caspase family protein [Streptomyces eurythermus]|uniref:caspase, EACC1-associated type n=1 Tax=Streptomyces eurythermus TaxID=42237 RepID=UPI00370302D0